MPPSVGRDKVEQMLRDRLREPDAHPSPPAEAPQLERPAQGDDAIRRLGEQLRRQAPLVPPVAGAPGVPEPG